MAPGQANRLRKFVSAPQISFDADVYTDDWVNVGPSNIPSAEAGAYILEDMRTVDDSLPGQAIPRTEFPDARKPGEALVGNAVSDRSTRVIEITKDPFTGKEVKKKVLVKTRITRSGETVLRETIC